VTLGSAAVTLAAVSAFMAGPRGARAGSIRLWRCAPNKNLMNMRQLVRRAWYALRQRELDAELAEEMECHRAMKANELEARGVDRDEAQFAARRAFGSAALAGDQSRDVWIPRGLQGIGQDLRLAVRTLRATPVVTTVAVLSLALGIGANTAIFSLVNGLLLRTLPVVDPRGSNGVDE
jgi:hypothetical protein